MDTNPNVIYQWLRTFSQGDVIALCLVGVAMALYHKLITSKIAKGVEKLPKPEEILTETKHAVACKTTLLEVKNLLMENRVIATKEISSLKELLMVTVRRDILEALKNNIKKE